MTKISIQLTTAAALALWASGAMAANVAIDTGNPANGLYDIYSATFDGGLSPCAPGSTYCTFFGGDPGATRAVLQTPDPSGVVNNVPGGIGAGGIPVAPAPGSGSFLDLTLGGGNTTLTLGGGSTVTFAPINLCIGGPPTCPTVNANAVNAGIVFRAPGAAIANPLTPAGGGSTGGTVAVDGNGKAVFQVQGGAAPLVDFSSFSQVVTSCTGGACFLVSGDILSLDMVRYVLEIDYDPTFTSFTGNLIGQTANNSLVYATLNSAVVPLPAAGWLLLTAVGGLAARRLKRAA